MRRLLIIPLLAGLLAIPAATANAGDRDLTGAALGATAGVFIAGPIGAVVGGVAGAVIGGPPLPHHGHRYHDRDHSRVCYDVNNHRVKCPPRY
jgi:hypothetical protein